MKKNIKKNEKGITLVALVVTIVVLLILAGISLNLVLGQNGIVNKAKESKEKGTQDQENTETALNTLYDEMMVSINGKGIKLVETLELELVKEETVTKNLTATLSGIEGEISWSNSENSVATISGTTGETITVTAVSKGETTITATCGDYSKTCKVIVIEPLKVGDFVNYTAGNWTSSDISKLGSLYAGEDLPTSSTPCKFGGFKIGDSKDASITPYGTSANTYSGWRVLKVDNGIVTIVHAGTPEGYYFPKEAKGAYKSEYILNENTTNESITDDIKGEVTETRDWSMYEDGNLAEASSARSLMDEEIEIFSESDNLRKTGSYYWIPRAVYGATGLELSYVASYGVRTTTSGNYCYGVRPVVTLKSNIKITGGQGTSSSPYTLALND